MKQYVFSADQSHLILADANGENQEMNENGLYLCEENEARQLPQSLARRSAFLASLRSLSFCKAESFGGCVIGTLHIPAELVGGQNLVQMAFHLEKNRLILVGNLQQIQTPVDAVAETSGDGLCAPILLLRVLDTFLADDVLYLQSIEEEFTQKEEMLLHTIPSDFNGYIMKQRRKLSRLHAYYEQLADVADVLESSLALVSEPQSNAWRLLGERCERLHNNTEALNEYLIQLRELYRSQMDIRQGRIMSLLTVVTTMLLPLSLVAAWYGMNFSNMLAINSPWGYPIVVLFVIILVVAEIIYFKKKKMF